MDLVMDISDRIYVLDFGELIAAGHARRRFRTTRRVIDAYLGVAEDAENLNDLHVSYGGIQRPARASTLRCRTARSSP